MSISINCIPVQPKTDCKYQYCASFIHVSPVDLPDIPIAKKWIHQRPSFFNDSYLQISELIADFEVRSDDIWVITFPKSGTTWTLEMIRMFNMDLDYDKAANIKQEDCYDMIDVVNVYKHEGLSSHSLKKIAARPSPRIIKSHLPIELLPKSIWTAKPKIIITSRNPKDTCVSYFHHYRNLHSYKGDLESFVKIFLADEVLYAPFYERILNYWSARHEPNILFFTYEEMKSDLMSVLRKTQHFLGKSFSEDQLERLSRYLHVDTMTNNPNANNSGMIEKIKQLGIDTVDPDYK